MTADPRAMITWGLLPDGCLDRVLVCSPHFDDAVPMGLANLDHMMTREAGALLAARRDDLTWFCYEDSQ